MEWAFAGLLEYKAALLASHGFAALALAYVSYEDLPKSLDEVELEYFEEGARMLLKHPHLLSHGVGLLSYSRGSVIALMLAAHQSDIIRAIVAVSPSHAHLISTLLHKGRAMDYIKADSERIKKMERNNDLITRECFHHGYDPNSPAVIPVEKINCPICLVCGTDDQFVNTSYMSGLIKQRMTAHGKGELCTVQEYPNVGHQLEPPYVPHCKFLFSKVFEGVVCLGGEMKAHAVASEDFWPKALKFFRKNLS